MIFPLFDINDGKITSLKGEVSFLYKILHEDITQKSNDDLMIFFQNFHQELKTFKEDCFYRFYFIDDCLYLNTDDQEIYRLGHQLEIVQAPLNILFNSEDVYRDIEVHEDFILIGHRYIRLLNLYELPSSVTECYLENFGDLVLNLKKLDPVKAKKRFDLKRKLHFSLSQEALRNLESEKAFSENENLLEDIMTGDEAVFNLEGWLIVKADSLEELNQKTINYYQLGKLQGLQLLSEGRGLAYFFSSIIPGVSPVAKRIHLAPAKFISGLIPFPNEQLFSSGIHLHSRSGRSVKIDLFHSDNPNFNALITGTSGQGKSVIANNILYEEVESGSKAVVLDLGNSFKKTTDFLGGVSLPSAFNPLQFKEPSYLKSFVMSVVDQKFFSITDEGKLFELISNLDFSIVKTNQDFIECMENAFPNIKYFFNELMPHFKDELYEMPSVLYCDLTLYPERIKAPLIIYLVQHFKNLVGKRIFIFDECWNLLQNQAGFIAESFRTFRKHEASAIAISQNLEDFLSTQLGRVIYQTTFFKFIFRQDTNAEFLTSFQKQLLETVSSKKRKYSEFLLVTDFHQKICRFYPRKFKFHLFNSDKNEIESFKQFEINRRGLLDFREIFYQFVTLKTGDQSWLNY